MKSTAVKDVGSELAQQSIEAFVHKALGDVAGALTASLVVIGDKLGLYKALADGPATTTELATRTGTTERYVREWLNAQAAAGYVTYANERYTLPPAHAACLTDEESPACVLGAFQAMTAATRANGKVAEGFTSGCGVGWHEHDPDLFVGVERFFRPGYNAHLVADWIPALDGVQEKLVHGARVAGSAPRRSFSPRRSRARRSLASTTTRRRSSGRASGRVTPASPIASASRSPPPRRFPAPATT